MKELRLRPFISDHDLQRKIAWARQALESGEQVKVTLRLRGRENALPGTVAVIERMASALADVANCDPPSRHGGSWSILLTPGKRA